MAAAAASRTRRCAKEAMASGNVASIGAKSVGIRPGVRAGHSNLWSAMSDRGRTQLLRVRRRQISRTALINWLAEVKLKRSWFGVLPCTAFSSSVSNAITQSQHSCASGPQASEAGLARSSGRQQPRQSRRTGPRGGTANRHCPRPHELHWSCSGQLWVWQKPVAARTQCCAGRPAAKSSARHLEHQEMRSIGGGRSSSGLPANTAKSHAAKSRGNAGYRRAKADSWSKQGCHPPRPLANSVLVALPSTGKWPSLVSAEPLECAFSARSLLTQLRAHPMR